MHKIKESTGAVVAQDTAASISALDAAFVMQARLCATVIEAASESKLPVAATQKLLDSITAGMRGLVASREEVVATVREINLIQSKSSLRVTSYGCPDGFRTPYASGGVETQEIAQAG